MKTKISETKFDELRSKTYLPQIEFAETVGSILYQETTPILEFVKIYHLLCFKAEKISEEKAEREAKQHFDILYTMMKMGDNFISRFLLIGQTLYSGRDRVIDALKNTDDVMYCEYYFNSTFYWVFLSKDISSANIVLDKIIEQYYEGDHTLYIFEMLMERYPEVKKSFYPIKSLKIYIKLQKIQFIGNKYPFFNECVDFLKVKYTQMKAKYLPRVNKTKHT